MTPLILLIDSNNLCYRMRYSLGDLSFEEQKVSIIFGFLRQILTLAKKFNTNHFVFCWDSRNNKRKEIYPAYKATRHKDRTEEEKELDEIAYTQFAILQEEILPEIGFKNNFCADGYESDDIIAKIVQTNKESKFIIVSTDNDLFQLLHKDVAMLIGTNKIYSWKDFTQDYHIHSRDWSEVKSIAGCISDNVIGVKGVGEKTAIKYLYNELNATSKSYKAIRANSDLIDLNRRLVTLPYEGTPNFSLIEDEFSIDNFLNICQRYGFNSLLTKDSLIQWKERFFK